MRTILASIAGLGLAACASSAPPLPATDAAANAAPSACFRSGDIRAHTFADRDTLYLSVRNDRVYRVKMRNGCLAGASPSDPIVTRPRSSASLICTPIEMDISILQSGGGFESACIVDSIALMSPAEVEALPPRLRP